MKNLFVILSLMLFFSCSGDDDSNNNNDDDNQTPKLVSLSSTVSTENSMYTTNFSDYSGSLQYNNEKLETWTINNLNNLSSNQFVYNDEGKIIKWINNLNENNETFSSVDLIQYTNGKISNIKSSDNNEQTFYLNYNFEYSDNTISLIDQISDNDRTIVVQNNLLTSFVDENHNIHFEYSVNNLVSKTLDGLSTIQYTYDEMKNPFAVEYFSNLGEVVMLMNSMGGFEFLFEDFNNQFYNQNNILSLTVENYSFGGIVNQNYTYTYNSEEFPLNKNVQNQFEVNYNYE